MASRISHQPYVQTVAAEVEGIGLTVVGPAVIGCSPVVRTAVITLEPPESGPYAQADEDFELVWDESFGWVVRLPDEAGNVPWFMGEDLVPSPERVARWVDLLLAFPGMVPSREDGPRRLPESADAVFETRLSAYAPPV